jgi:hypothetical protein
MHYDTQSPIMLAGDWVPREVHGIDFDNLPRVPSQHTVVSEVRGRTDNLDVIDTETGGVNQHNYLAHHAGKLWIMWSDGRGVEDRVGQRVSFSNSEDGVDWCEPRFITPEPPGSGVGSEFYGTRTDKGFRYISRGFWQRGGDLFALAGLDEAAGFFGASLSLRAFRLNERDETWEDAGMIFDDAINNFPPKLLPTGEWMMTRRTHDYRERGIHVLIGGTEGINYWDSYPISGTTDELTAEEPLWWVLPDDNLMALFRDNRHSGYLFRAYSTDNGRTWTPPVQTNFPDACSKLNGLRLSDGRYVLVSNPNPSEPPNPRKRDPLAISISDDGRVFHSMGYLVGGRWVDYPHVMEHEGHLYVTFSGGKQSVEILKVRIEDLEFSNRC